MMATVAFANTCSVNRGFPDGSVAKNPPAMQELPETWVQSLSQKDPLEEGMVIHSNILGQRNLTGHSL